MKYVAAGPDRQVILFTREEAARVISELAGQLADVPGAGTTEHRIESIDGVVRTRLGFMVGYPK